MRWVITALALCAALPVSAEVAMFSQRNFQGARYSLEQEATNIMFSPRSVRVADETWELCPRPFFGGTCLTVSENVPNLSLPRAFSGMVRSARKAGGTSVAPPVEGAASSSSKDAPPK